MLFFDDPYYFATLIATLVVFAQVVGILTALLMIFRSDSPLLRYLAHNAASYALTVAVVAVASSLTFSDIFDMNPCKLCWFQRILIFPQVLLLGMGLWREQMRVLADYCLTFACLAMPVSLFHYLLQMTDAPAVHAFAPCDVTGQAPSCSSFYVLIYGYVTIPMMALTTSALIALLMLLYKRS